MKRSLVISNFLEYISYYCSVNQSCMTLCDPWMAACQDSLSFTISWSWFKLMSIESVMLFNHLILCCLLLLLPSIFPSIRVSSNKSSLCIGWLKYWTFSFHIIPFNECSGLISFRSDWFDILAVQETLKSLLQHHSLKASVLQCSAFLIVHLSHPYISTGKTRALTIQTFVGKVMPLLLNMLSRFVIAFLPRQKPLLISWLQSPSTVTLKSKKIKSVTVTIIPHLFAMKWWDWMPWSSCFECWVLSHFFTLLFHFHQEVL